MSEALKAILQLRQGSLRNETPIRLTGELTVTADSDVYLARPGIDATQIPFDQDLSSWLHGQPLDSDAAGLVASASNPADLMSWALDQSSATISLDKASAEDGTVRGSFCPNCLAQTKPGTSRCDVCGASLDQRTSVFSTQRISRSQASAGAVSQLVSTDGNTFELLLTSLDSQPLNLMLHGVSEGDRLHISVPPTVRLSPGATERVKVEVSPRKRRLYGRKTWQFSVVASSSGGRDLPPILANATFEEWRWLPLAAASFGGLAIAGLVAAALVLGGGSNDRNETKSAIAPDAPVATAAAAQAVATPESAVAAPASASAEPPTPAPPLPPPSLPGGAAPPAQPAPASVGGSQTAPATSPAQNVPRALPTMAPSFSTRVCPTSPPNNDLEKFQGCRVYEAMMDGALNNSFSGSFGNGACRESKPDPATSSVQFLPGAVDLSVSRRGGQTYLPLNSLPRSSYVVAYDISFAAGSRSSQLIVVRTGPTQGIILSVETANDTLALWLNDNTAGRTDLTPTANLPGLRDGRRYSIAAAVSPDRITAFVDGKIVIDLRDSRLPSSVRPQLFTQICPESGIPASGTLRVHSARVYELAGQ